MNRKKRGFTLVELLAVVAIVTTLAALVIGGTTSAVQKARAVKCASNMRQLGLSARLYANDNNQCLPVTSHQNYDAAYGNVGGKTSWTVTLQEYAGGKIVFRCPVDEITRNYTYVLNDFLSPSSGLNYWRLSRLEKPARTFLFAEAARTYANSDHFHFADYMGRTIPDSSFLQQIGARRHQQAANYVFADGHMEIVPWTEAQNRLRDRTEQFVEPLIENQPNLPNSL